MGDDFTEREQKLMALAWQCFQEQPEIDFDKLAGIAGYTNPRSASNAWAVIKKKLTAQAAKITGENGEADTDAAATPKPKATPRKRGRKAAGEDDEDGATPAKKAKGRKGKAKPVSEDADDDESSGVKAESSDQDGLV